MIQTGRATRTLPGRQITAKSKQHSYLSLLILIIVLIIALTTQQWVYADPTLTRAQDMQLAVGQSLVVQSDHNTIQKLFLTGNLTYLNLTKPQLYPASEFGVAATGRASYEIQVLFDSPGDYTVNLFVMNQDSGLTRTGTTYYLSGDPFELDINATFSPRPNETATVVPSQPPMQSFAKWIGKFSEAFPLWVKLLYLGMGIQFFTVGGGCGSVAKHHKRNLLHNGLTEVTKLTCG